MNSYLTTPEFIYATSKPKLLKPGRIESIDVLRGIVMIIMALDHVRDYFHYDAFLYSPTDLTKTNVFLFFTRFITHYCAPVFVFLAGISAHLYGINKSKTELAFYLFSRGLWLVFTELFIISLVLTFNPSYPMFNLQVIWAIGVSMIVLSAFIYINKKAMLIIAILLIAAHNLLDNIHVAGTGLPAFFWSLLHEDGDFIFGHFNVLIHYPILPWIGIITLGYCFGNLYQPGYDPVKRKRILLLSGSSAIIFFLLFRGFNIYGDAAHWFTQKNIIFSILSILNVTKYPPSLLYVMITLGPALIFLALGEKPLSAVTKKIVVFGRAPFFYYVLHLFLIHLFATAAAILSGYKWSDMILSTRVNRMVELRGYGFNLYVVYFVWIGLILLLYPCCKWFGNYKRTHQSYQWWLSYL